jgi:hypothetical protein
LKCGHVPRTAEKILYKEAAPPFALFEGWDLQLARAPEAEYVAVVVGDFKSAKSVVGVFQMLVYRNGSADVLFVQ